MRRLLLLALVPAWWHLRADPAGEELVVRLTTPLTTAAAGARFAGVVTSCTHSDCGGALPPGSVVEGIVQQVWPVGLGIRRERESLALKFTGCRLPSGEAIACHAELVAVDNARETVTEGNRIHGIYAADNPHSLLSGVWFRPSSALLTRSLSGLNGAGKMLYRGISPHPAIAGAIIAGRLALLRLPDPAIRIPEGAELIVRVTAERGNREAGAAGAKIPAPLEKWLAGLPVRVTLPDGSTATDLLNFAVRGSSAEVALAFLGAGWITADPLNRHTFARSYRAFTELRPYATAPVSPLRYEGRLPDLVFQKSFNTIAKRHHIRLWKMESPEGTMWLGAATHDVGIAFDWKRLSLTHRIDGEIDRERDRVLGDLTFSGCAWLVGRVERPWLAQKEARLTTDGVLHLAAVEECTLPAATIPTPGRKPGFGKLALRRTILEARQYVLRGNAYYWTFRGLKTRHGVNLLARARSLAGRYVGGAGRDRTDE